jgi:hypothetical protein
MNAITQCKTHKMMLMLPLLAIKKSLPSLSQMSRKALKEVNKIKPLATHSICPIFLRLMEELVTTHLSNFKKSSPALKEKVQTRMKLQVKPKNHRMLAKTMEAPGHTRQFFLLSKEISKELLIKPKRKCLRQLI